MKTEFTTQSACELIQAHRDDAVVVSTMTAMKAMDSIAPDEPLSLSSVPLMGGAAGLGLGLALAQPDRKIFVLDGDASLLMELGVLSTIAQAQPAHFIHFVFSNGVQFNGNGNLPLPSQKTIDFVAVARAVGYAQGWRCASTAELERLLSDVQKMKGPVLIELILQPDPPSLGPGSPAPEQPDKRFERMGAEARRLMTALGTSFNSEN
jgi:phosphonopyruvate decarboxylase